MPNWKFAILHGHFPPGKRHDSMLALAAYFKGAGFPAEITKNMVFEASRLQYERFKDHYKSDPTDEGELSRTIDHIYGPTWTGGTFAYDQNEKLKQSIIELFPEGTFETEFETQKNIKSIKDILTGFKTFSKNIDKNRVLFGIEELDKKVMMTTGMLTFLLGAPGSAKTAISLNILANNSKMGIHSMFFSLDMSENLIGGKLMSRQSPIGFRHLTEKYKNDEDLSEVENMVEEDFKNVSFYSKSATSVKEMRTQIHKYQKETGHKIKFVVVDYLELIHGPYADLTANSAHHAIQLKDMATDLDICLLVLVQPQKSAGDAGQPLSSMRSVKGASLLEQNARLILGIYREGFSPDTPEKDKFLTIKGLKCTFESLFSVDMGWDGQTGRVFPLTPELRAELKALREKKKEDAEAKKKSIWDDA
jgi:replicative DNA helicase